jgi:glutamine---fructose-6-phosphate transaminase (isomerizing)
MCGIVGYVGSRNATPLIIEGLGRLEYRGYDSAGVAVVDHDEIKIRRDVGKLSNLRNKLDGDPISGGIGIGHTQIRDRY